MTACGGGSGGASGTSTAPSNQAPVTATPGTSTGDTPVTPVVSAPVIVTGPVGVVVKPLSAISSGDENGGLSAAMAIDGKLDTRWASKAVDDASITFDFGATTAVGAIKLTWENAYAKDYLIRASADGQTWTVLRQVTGSAGGVEELLNLNANARYLQLQGVTRSSQYGISLYEVEFKSPGSDNTLAVNATSPFKFPADGSAMAALPASAPLEVLQFSLADGTLVTRYGARAMGRHGRERGEEWNEIGYGLNDTIDLATGATIDRGPGSYLTFVAQYFQNRTWGIEIIDNSLVKGVSNPQLIVNNYNQVDFLPGGTPFVRGWDRPEVTGYGWMTGPAMQDNNVTLCKPVAYPAAGVLATSAIGIPGINNGCTMKFTALPGHAQLNSDGFPTGGNVPARALVPGDEIEIAPSMFSTVESMAAVGDKGNIRYYGPELMYVMGKGLRPWYGVFPRLNSTPLPDSSLSGGLGSVSYNYSDNGLFMFQQPSNNVGMQNIQRFVEGRRVIHANFTTGAHNEPGNDPYLPVANLQGPRYNQSACIGCHTNNGRGPAPSVLNQKLDAMAIRVAALDSAGQQVPHPLYGASVQMNGGGRNWGTTVRVASFQTQNVSLADGSIVELRKPVLAFEGPAPAIYSLRAAQPMIGTGLLEAIAEADILARVRTTADADGVKGTANYAYDPESGAVRLGRFGWKAAKATLRQQSAEALLLDMGVTSPVFPNRACANGPTACAGGGTQAGISEADLQKISRYLALVAVPAQRNLASGFPKGVAPLDEHKVDPVQVGSGARLFDSMRCSACHAVEMKTGAGHLFAELRSQTIRPYSDLLLHDMGDGLADKLAEGQASGAMWRTSPLWGIGYTDKVAAGGAAVGYLHDGRARTLPEAIVWHGGEATVARNRFVALSKADREALLAFLRSL